MRIIIYIYFMIRCFFNMRAPLTQCFHVGYLIFFSISLVYAGDLGLPPAPIPADNPQSPEKIVLGQKLFADKRLSADGSVSCATCHDPEKAFKMGARLPKA